jgi:hypothetical protein
MAFESRPWRRMRASSDAEMRFYPSGSSAISMPNLSPFLRFSAFVAILTEVSDVYALVASFGTFAICIFAVISGKGLGSQAVLQYLLKFADREAAFWLFIELEIQLGMQHSPILSLLGFAPPKGTLRPVLESDDATFYPFLVMPLMVGSPTQSVIAQKIGRRQNNCNFLDRDWNATSAFK